jgi:serine/threonine protein kinase
MSVHSHSPNFDPDARYELPRPLGQGGVGAVYLATDRQHGTMLALKKLHRIDANSVEALKREFRLLADVQHTNLIRMYDLVAGADGWFITMEYLDGVDLMSHVNQLLRREPVTEPASDTRRPFSVADLTAVLQLFVQFARGVRALHLVGVLHRESSLSSMAPLSMHGRGARWSPMFVASPTQASRHS